MPAKTSGKQNNAALMAYVASVRKEVATGAATEHTMRPALKQLIETVVPSIHALNEPKQEAYGAPDYQLRRNDLPVGYIETKDPNVNLDGAEKTEQLLRYRAALDNLILTDYLEFRWFVNGKTVNTVRIGDIDGTKVSLDEDALPKLEELLKQVTARHPEPITKADDLARRMANHAHIISGMIRANFAQHTESKTLKDLRAALAKVLMPGLEAKTRVSEFADLYSQCIVYGLFAARCNHKKGPFIRAAAAKEIPKTNPFLQKLFEVITGVDLDDEPYVCIVDDLVHTLDNADIAAVLADFGTQGSQDPVIHFYETFLRAYDPELKKIRGVFYTPTPAVNYVVRSIDALLKEHFKLDEGLADISTRTYIEKTFVDESGNPHEDGKVHDVEKPVHRTIILDPSCGTATFLHSVVGHIRQQFIRSNNAGLWSAYVKDHLLPRMYGFELLMAPYAIAHFKLAMQLAGHDLPPDLQKDYEYDFQAKQRLNIYLTNTLDSPDSIFEGLFGPFRIITDEARAASRVKRDLPIMVILGNPPWKGESANKGKAALDLVKDFQEFDGRPLKEIQQKWLYNDYVKFTSWARRRIEKTGYGILGFVLPNGFLEGKSFRGMRQKLMETFEDIYILDLHGNVKRREKAPGGTPDRNIFDIEPGVAVALMVRSGSKRPSRIHHCDLYGTREAKFAYLEAHSCTTTQWTTFEPQRPLLLFKPEDERAAWDTFMGLEDAMPLHKVGMVSSRDDFCFQLSREELLDNLKRFIDLEPAAARKVFHLKAKEGKTWRTESAQQDILGSNANPKLVRPVLYRPFDIRYTYYSGTSKGFLSEPQSDIMRHMLEGDNLAVITSKTCEIDRWEHVLCTSLPIQHHTVSTKEVNDLFPLRLKGGQAKLGDSQDVGAYNFSKEYLDRLQESTGLAYTPNPKLAKEFGPLEAFGYIVGILNCPTYQSMYQSFMRTGFPRIPMPPDASTFRAFSNWGVKLALLQAGKANPSAALPAFPVKGTDIVDAEALRFEDGNLFLNKNQYFANVPARVWDYSLGGRQVAEKWFKDRDGRRLSGDELLHARTMLAAITDTFNIKAELDGVTEWPLLAAESDTHEQN